MIRDDSGHTQMDQAGCFLGIIDCPGQDAGAKDPSQQERVEEVDL